MEVKASLEEVLSDDSCFFFLYLHVNGSIFLALWNLVVEILRILPDGFSSNISL